MEYEPHMQFGNFLEATFKKYKGTDEINFNNSFILT